MRFILIIFLVILFNNCKSSDKRLIIDVLQPIDSFYVEGDVYSITIFNEKDSAIFKGELLSGKTNSLIMKGRDTFFYQDEFKSDVQKSILAFIDSNNYYFLGMKEMIIYNSSNKTSLIKPLKVKKPYLKNNYAYENGITYPSKIIQNKLFLSCFNTNSNYLEDFFKEDCIDIYDIQNENFVFKKSIIPRPKNLFNYFGLHSYCFADDDKIALLLSPIDSIYIYNITKDSLYTIQINNEYYKTPDYFDYKKNRVDPNYSDNYYKNNFSYKAIFYNIPTQEYYLIFHAPYNDKKADENSYNFPYVLVLDRDFKHKKMLKFNNIYWATMQYIFPYDNDKIALPIYNIDKNEKFTKYHVFKL